MELLRKKVLHLSAIPRNLDSVISIDSAKEVDPQEVGMQQADVEKIWGNVIKVYQTGVHPAITVSLRRQGKVILSRAIGHSHGNGPDDSPDTPKVLASTDTPICLFSTSKAVTAVLMHMLVEDGLINLMDPVSFYAPEFARKGKGNITIHLILAHRGGIPGLPKNVAIDTLWDEDAPWALLCDAEPSMTDGSKLAYHAITGGFVLERVIRKVTGDNINAYIDRKIRQPMGMQHFTYGMPADKFPELAQHYATGPRPGLVLGNFIKRALGTDIVSVTDMCNDPRFYQAIIPAGNLVATASEVSAFFQMLLNGGKWGRKRICAESTVRRAVQEFGKRSIDRTLLLPMRYSAGLMLGDKPFGIWGPHSERAFGHVGLINKFAWADPQRELSATILSTGLPVIAHHIMPLAKVIHSIGHLTPRSEHISPLALQLK